MAVNNVSEHIRIAQTLTQNTVPVLILKPGLKRPLAKPGTDRWWVLDDPDNVEAAFQSLGNHVVPNIGMLLGWQKQSPVIGVGADLYKDKKAGDKLKELGVSSNAAVWIQRTGRGGLTLIYYSPDVELKRDIEPEGEAIDLLLNGYTVISPSNTSNEPGGGGPYTWVKGHSPYDIPLAELDTPPKDLLLWWQSLSAKPLPQVQAGNGNAHDGLITGPIPEGQRDERLTKIYGALLRKHSPVDAASILHAINVAHCIPPLETRQVEKIIASINRADGRNHSFRGVHPATLEHIK